MWPRKLYYIGGPQRFFSLTLAHETLALYFKLNFQLMQHHKYSLSELENMIPWEREIYTAMLSEHVQEENKKIEQARKQ